MENKKVFFLSNPSVDTLYIFNIYYLKRAAIKMRDQCGLIFRQARRELEAAGLLPDSKDGTQGTANTSEDSLASDIDRELENLQVTQKNSAIFKTICDKSNLKIIYYWSTSRLYFRSFVVLLTSYAATKLPNKFGRSSRFRCRAFTVF